MRKAKTKTELWQAVGRPRGRLERLFVPHTVQDSDGNKSFTIEHSDQTTSTLSFDLAGNGVVVSISNGVDRPATQFEKYYGSR